MFSDEKSGVLILLGKPPLFPEIILQKKRKRFEYRISVNILNTHSILYFEI